MPALSRFGLYCSNSRFQLRVSNVFAAAMVGEDSFEPETVVAILGPHDVRTRVGT